MTKVTPEATTQATNQAIREDSTQDTGAQEITEATAPQEQPVKKSQNKRPVQRKTAPRKQRGSGEAQKKRNTGSRQSQTKGRDERKGENQTGTTTRKSEDSAGTRSSKGTGSARISRNSGESKASRDPGGSRDSEESRNSGKSKTFRNPEGSKNFRDSDGSGTLPTPAKQKARGGGKDGESELKIIPLGGLEQIGMNITVSGYEDSIIVMDYELVFPGNDMLGIDLVIPGMICLKQNIDEMKSFVITYSHEGHIDALLYILRQVNMPVYGVKLTIALTEYGSEEHRLLRNTKHRMIKHGQSVNLGCFGVELVKTNHSIQDASALVIFTPVGIVLHTGDFKVDYVPVFRDPIDLRRFTEPGRRDVLTPAASSADAIRPGFTIFERTVGKTFDAIFAEHQDRRIIMATFAFSMNRVQQVVNTAYKYRHRVVVEGCSMVTIMDIASKLGYANAPKETLIDIEHLRNYLLESTVLITTGDRGEPMVVLSRMAVSIHKKAPAVPGNVAVLGFTPIPGNEKAVVNVVNELSVKGARVIYQDTHISGHACREGLKLVYSLVHPRFSIPIHGEYRRHTVRRELAQLTDVQKKNAVMINSDSVVTPDENSYEVIDHVTCGDIFMDGLGAGDVGNTILRDRQNLAQNGIIVIVLVLEKHSNQLLVGPNIVSRGFVCMRESEDLLEEAHTIVYGAVQDCLNCHVSDWGKIKGIIKGSLSDFL